MELLKNILQLSVFVKLMEFLKEVRLKCIHFFSNLKICLIYAYIFMNLRPQIHYAYKKGVFVFLPKRFDEEHIVTDKTFFLSLLVIKLLALFQSFTLDSRR